MYLKEPQGKDKFFGFFLNSNTRTQKNWMNTALKTNLWSNTCRNWLQFSHRNIFFYTKFNCNCLVKIGKHNNQFSGNKAEHPACFFSPSLDCFGLYLLHNRNRLMQPPIKSVVLPSLTPNTFTYLNIVCHLCQESYMWKTTLTLHFRY